MLQNTNVDSDATDHEKAVEHRVESPPRGSPRATGTSHPMLLFLAGHAAVDSNDLLGGSNIYTYLDKRLFDVCLKVKKAIIAKKWLILCIVANSIVTINTKSATIRCIDYHRLIR